ncbi:hypothetical protein Hanom_Chr08g00746971 [Helianthus anomalus]
MQPRRRGMGKGPMRGRGPSKPQPSHSHHSKHSEHSNESHLSQPTRHPYSHHSHSHHSHSHHDSFHASNYLNSPYLSQNQLDNDSDPKMPPSGSNQHPIELSSDTASYAGLPYQGPDKWDQYFNQFTFY